jgi:queuine tRNA-ribosyltransferase
MPRFSFDIGKKLDRARAGKISTPHGSIETPAFVPVGTKATLKAITPAQAKELGVQVMFANTYHLYLQPGDEVVRDAGGLHAFMNWDRPLMTDSGGFQVFSLGAGFGKNITKVAQDDIENAKDFRAPSVYDPDILTQHGKLAVIDEEGVTFTSHIDGSLHRFTPERSIEIQHNLGADIIVAFDECTGATESHTYQEDAMHRTHRWAERSIKAHRQNIEMNKRQAIYGVVQGGRFEDLRRYSAKTLASMDFDGFGIGGSYVKEDLDTAVGWVCEELPEEKPRHLLGIGEPMDVFNGVEKGVDTFDCVAATRVARTGQVYTAHGKITISRETYIRDFSPLEESCDCYTCRNFTRAYVCHLFRADEMLGPTLATVHNLRFFERLFASIREGLQNGDLAEVRKNFEKTYPS